MPYGDEYEVLESRFLRFNNEGVSGSRKYRVPGWAYIEEGYYNQLGLPVMGQAWSLYLPYLVVCDISCNELGQDAAEITVEYSSDGMYAVDFMSTELDADLTDAKYGFGWKWQTTQQPVEATENYAIPAGRYTVTLKSLGYNKQKILTAMNSVNSGVWHGFPAETLMFTGARTSAKYSTSGAVTSVETQYSFEFQSFSHNLRYRPPRAVKNKQGQIYYYHTDANATGVWAQYYVLPTDPRAYTPVLIDTGGWDKPIINTTDPVSGQAATVYLHTPVNFSTALDIPDIAQPQPAQVQNNES